MDNFQVYTSVKEIVLQATSLVWSPDHPMHLHGHSFYVVGSGIGNFDEKNDPLNYNLVDPPLRNTIAVPRNGWTTIRFKTNNPGTCHFFFSTFLLPDNAIVFTQFMDMFMTFIVQSSYFPSQL